MKPGSRSMTASRSRLCGRCAAPVLPACTPLPSGAMVRTLDHLRSPPASVKAWLQDLYTENAGEVSAARRRYRSSPRSRVPHRQASRTQDQMASRTKQKEEARARRQAEEQARAEKARRERRLRMLGGVALIAVAIVAVAIAISSGGGGNKTVNPNSSAGKQAATTVNGLLAGIP